MNNQTLLKLSSGQLTKKQAYHELYPRQKIIRKRKAHFVKIKIIIPDEAGVSRFLAFLFFLPIPLLFAKIAVKKMKNSESYGISISNEELLNLVSVRGIKIEVQSNSGEKIYIKTL